MKATSASIKVAVVLTALFLSTALARAFNNFDWENLQSDIHGVAKQTDPNVVNPWGMALAPSGNVWVSNNGTGVATVYHQDGTPAPNSINPQIVTIPASASNSGGASPTGIVSNPTSFFTVSNGTNSLPAKFIFVSEDGVISGWNPSLDSTLALKVKDNGPAAVYKGATMGVSDGHNFLFVTNFRSGHVETYDENFNQVNPRGFPDANLLAAGYAPFGIGNFNGEIFVTYAKQNAAKHDDVAGPGNGFINVFNTKGQFLRRLVSHTNLNSPWGLALAGFPEGNLEVLGLWVGNFGDGRINVYNPINGSFFGAPKDVFGNPLDFDDLWGLLVAGNGLFFSAGIVDEAHGLFGHITQNSSPLK